MCYKGVQHSSSFPPFSILTASITTNPFVVVIALVAASRLLRRSFLFPFLGSQSSSACRPMMTPRLLQLRRVRKQRAPLRILPDQLSRRLAKLADLPKIKGSKPKTASAAW